ncbi:MAG TPA: saccharopine dehydrogenase NADP-binding domain-containing protein [Candidatus Polarisedimenticolia bacterium]|nr:saccharopine dehydrogenase NADP-binding domain-containing protein [Candidatus Polarisedimenticolia bacterium]
MSDGKKSVLVLGAGAQGNVVATLLSRARDVGTIVLADLDETRAAETAASVGSAKVRTARVDVTAVEPTAALMRSGGFDLVVNVAPPQFIPEVMHAALLAGRNYLDLSSVKLYEIDGLPYEQMQEADAWAASGRIALINAGSAPGLTNIMAREAADRLDEVDRIAIKDFALTTGDEYVPLWILSVYAIDCATEPYVWDDGRPVRVPIFSGEEMYDFPPPIGRPGKVYLHAHEEPVSIPLHLGKPVRYCDYKIGEPDIDAWRFLVERLRLMDETPVDVRGVRVAPRDLLLKMLPPTPSPQRLQQLIADGRIASRSMLTCDVSGRRAGRPVALRLWTDGPDLAEASRFIPGASDISLVTSAPAAVFALMILRGQIERTGVVLPESLSREERDLLLEGIADCGIEIRRRETRGGAGDDRPA